MAEPIRLIVTQLTPRSPALIERLTRRGLPVFTLPFASIVDAEYAPTPSGLCQAIEQSNIVIPVSPTAIERMLDGWQQGKGEAPWPASTRLAVVGPGSLRALVGRLPAAVVERVIVPSAPPYDASHLIDLPSLPAVRDLRVLVLRGESGRDDWIDRLRKRGATVTTLALYRNLARTPDEGERLALLDWLGGGHHGKVNGSDLGHRPVVWWFSQHSVAVRGCEWLRATGQSALMREHRAWAIHPRIAQALIDGGWRDVTVIEPGEAGLLVEIESAG